MPFSAVIDLLQIPRTTLLNYILEQNHGKKIAIIENEFGEVRCHCRSYRNGWVL